MGEKTGIDWTTHTFNIVWGCVKVSPGCTNCYAESQSKRYGWNVWGTLATRRTFGKAHWDEPLKWNRKAAEANERRRVFCGSMCDWAEDHPTVAEARPRLFELIEATPWLDWLLLTKRPENIMGMVPPAWAQVGFPGNVWVGTTTENQEYADKRIPLLLQVPARICFLSAEPLVGPVNLDIYLGNRPEDEDGAPYPGKVDWVIVGGESGAKARPMSTYWVRDLRDQCKAAKVPFFFKQMGTVWAKEHDLPASDHGSNPETWDADLRIREFPNG